MIFIQKGKEPESLTIYKRQLHASYDGYGGKEELREALLKNQGYICAYCMRRIENDRNSMKIEHWKAQSQLETEEEKLDFRIMLGVCDGCRGSADSYCGFLEKAGARKKRGQSRMIRPTTKENVVLDKNYYFAEPVEADKEEIIQVVYESHMHGYASTITGPPDRKGTEEAVNRCFTAFSETGTLHFGTIVKAVDTHRVAAVCLAGIYPGACDHFSTIHQVSVLSQYRRKGLAEAMIRNTINTAHSQSPVITLGVMTGNPAKRLYSKVGFISGMEYNDYVL